MGKELTAAHSNLIQIAKQVAGEFAERGKVGTKSLNELLHKVKVLKTQQRPLKLGEELSVTVTEVKEMGCEREAVTRFKLEDNKGRVFFVWNKPDPED